MKKYIFKVLIIIWMIIVFCFSNQPSNESSKLSGGITETIIKMLNITDNMPEEKAEIFIDNTETVIRKLAHYSIYTLGGIVIFLEMNQKNITAQRRVLYSQTIGSLYAVTDEIHQLFIPGRSGEVRDVCIDSLGIITGIILAMIFCKIIKRGKNEKIYCTNECIYKR